MLTQYVNDQANGNEVSLRILVQIVYLLFVFAVPWPAPLFAAVSLPTLSFSHSFLALYELSSPRDLSVLSRACSNPL